MRPHRYLEHGFHLSAVTFAVLVFFNAESFADLYVYRIKTVEWLVDNSDVIAVVRDSGDVAGTRPVILSAMKGNSDSIKWPLQNDKSGSEVYGPKSDGPVRLIFVQGNSTLLAAVALGRELPILKPTIHDIFYGVTQYGDLILTPSRLLQAVQTRIHTGPGKPLAHKPQSSTADDAAWAPAEFPLEASDEIYLLIVPFTIERRDHYIQVLRTGDATARIQAIHELSRFADDETAVLAIRQATGITGVLPSYRYSRDRKFVEALTSADVRLAAKKALGEK